MLFELVVILLIVGILFAYVTKPLDKSLKTQIQSELAVDSSDIITNLIGTVTAKAATGFGATFDIKDFIIFKLADVKLSTGEKNTYLGIMQHWIPLEDFSLIIQDVKDYTMPTNRKPTTTQTKIHRQKLQEKYKKYFK